jgi:hypothetical protein
MLKYASKLFLEMSLSVLATVIGAYVANHYVWGKSPADVSALFASTKVDPEGSGRSVASQATEKANPPPLVDPSSPANPFQADDSKASVEKAGMPIDKRAEVIGLPTRPQRTARDTRISRASKTAAPAGASLTFATATSHAPSERVPAARENSSTGTVLRPWEIERDDAIRLPPESTRDDSHFVGRLLGPMMRKALLLLRKPADLLWHEGDERGRLLYERLASSATRPDASEGRSFGAKGSVQGARSEASEQ